MGPPGPDATADRPAERALPRRLLAMLAGGPAARGRAVLACKTVCAVAAVLLLLSAQPLVLRLLGATGTAFLMQCVGAASGNARSRYQHWCMVACGTAMSGLMGLALILRGHPLAQDALLVALSGAVFAVRRRLPDHATFPLFLFTTTLLTAAMGERSLTVQPVACCLPLVALAISYPMYFLVLPRLEVPIPGPAVSARTPYRAALAALLAVAVQHFVDLPRAYWSVLVAVLITAETHQDLLNRAGDRLIMTVVGSVTGLLLHFASRDIFALQLAILLISIFGATFYRAASNRLMVGFLSVYVVFLFAIIGQWDVDLVVVRVYETAIGCAIALLVPLVLPYDAAPPAPRPDA